MRFGLLIDPPVDQRIVGKIISGISPGWWIIEDDQGRKYRVAGAGLLQRGESVAAVGGQIVDTAGTPDPPQVRQV